MLNKILKRTIALALAAVTFGLPLLSNDALAASHVDNKPAQKIENRVDKKAPEVHKTEKKDNHQNNDKNKNVQHNIHKEDNKHKQAQKIVYKPAPKHETHRPEHQRVSKHDNYSSNDKLAAGLVIGAILGAVIANAN